MKTLLSIVFAVSVFGQEAALKTPAPVIPSSKALTADDFAYMTKAAAKLELLNQQFRMKEYQEQAAPIIKEFNDRRAVICTSVGIAPADQGSKCNVDITQSKDNPLGVVQWLPPTPPPVTSEVKPAPAVDAKNK